MSLTPFTQQLIDRNGARVWQDRQQAFGAMQELSGAGENNIRFPGQYYDSETGLHYNYFRYYDPSTGRYITSDPLGIEPSLNTYAYVDSNPLYWVDQFGLHHGKPHGQMGHRGGGRRTTVRFPGSSCGPEGSPKNYPNKFWGPPTWEDACRAHDRCYGDCSKSRKSKKQCDFQFYIDIRRSCRKDNSQSPLSCNLASIAYYPAVAFGGGEAFKKARSKCGCSETK